MTTMWIAALIVAGLVISVARTVISGMLREEAQTRLSRIPHALIRLAAARVPADLRDDLAAEWNAELEFVLTGTDGLPITRLVRGIRYSAGLLLSARKITDGLAYGDLSRARRRTATLIAIVLLLSGSTIWILAGLFPKSRHDRMIKFADQMLHVMLALLPPERPKPPRRTGPGELGKTDIQL